MTSDELRRGARGPLCPRNQRGRLRRARTGRWTVTGLGGTLMRYWRLPEERTYPAVLQRELTARLGEEQVITFNCGVPGYSSYQGLRMLQRYQPLLRPDFAVISYGWNEDRQRHP